MAALPSRAMPIRNAQSGVARSFVMMEHPGSSDHLSHTEDHFFSIFREHLRSRQRGRSVLNVQTHLLCTKRQPTFFFHFGLALSCEDEDTVYLLNKCIAIGIKITEFGT